MDLDPSQFLDLFTKRKGRLIIGKAYKTDYGRRMLLSEHGRPLGDRPFALQGMDDKRNISAMRIQIDYEVPAQEVVTTRLSWKDLLFKQRDSSKPEDFTVLMDDKGQSQAFGNVYALDAFAIRDTFAEIKEREVPWFLEHAGPFWLPCHPVSFRQFQEWQEFVNILRQEGFHDRVLTDKRAAQAMQVLMRSSDRFFSQPLCPAPKWMGLDMALRPGPEQDLVQAYFKFDVEMRVLCSWFERPPNGAFSIEWDSPDENGTPSGNDIKRQKNALTFPREFSISSDALTPRLRIVPRNVLEAIAATIYVDRCRGIKYGKCDFCERLFKRESDHGQKYCRRELPDGRVVESCKNAAAQRAWRDRKKEEREKEKKSFAASTRHLSSSKKGKKK